MNDKQENDQHIANAGTQGGQFSLQKIYVKDVSFETPNSPEIFTAEWSPTVNMNLASEEKKLNDDLNEVVLKVTVTVELDKKTAYLVEVQIAGIFHIKDIPPEITKRMTATLCPNILFPFARELVSDLVTRGGFPQLLLAPVNFEALYAQQLQQQKEQQEKVTTEKSNSRPDTRH